MCLSTVIGPASGGLGRGVPGGNSVGYTRSRARTVTILSYPLLSPSATPSIAYATLSIAQRGGYGQVVDDRPGREATQGISGIGRSAVRNRKRQRKLCTGE